MPWPAESDDLLGLTALHRQPIARPMPMAGLAIETNGMPDLQFDSRHCASCPTPRPRADEISQCDAKCHRAIIGESAFLVETISPGPSDQRFPRLPGLELAKPLGSHASAGFGRGFLFFGAAPPRCLQPGAQELTDLRAFPGAGAAPRRFPSRSPRGFGADRLPIRARGSLSGCVRLHQPSYVRVQWPLH